MRRVLGIALVLASVTVAGRAAAAPPVHLHVADDSTCEGSRGLASRLAGRGIVLAEQGMPGVDVDGAASVQPLEAATTQATIMAWRIVFMVQLQRT